MARGWESKAVDDQQQEASRDRRPRAPALTPDEQAREQRRAALLLARARTEADLMHADGGYAEMLRTQRAAIEQQLAALDAPAP